MGERVETFNVQRLTFNVMLDAAAEDCFLPLSAVPWRSPCTPSLTLPLKSAAVAATTQRSLSRSTSSFSG